MNEPLSPSPIQPRTVTAPPAPSAEEVRQEHINHEASLKSVGALYCIGAAFFFLFGIGIVLISGETQPVQIGMMISNVCLSAFQFFVGMELRKLRRWTRVPIGILSGLGLLAFPFGTIINGYILYLLFSKKGSMVLSQEYRDVIEVTPDFKYKTSKAAWIFLGLFVLLFASFILAASYSN